MATRLICQRWRTLQRAGVNFSSRTAR